MLRPKGPKKNPARQPRGRRPLDPLLAIAYEGECADTIFNIKRSTYARDTINWMAVNPPHAIVVTISPLLVHNTRLVSDPTLKLNARIPRR